MKRFRNHLIGVAQGDEVLFSEFESGGDMWTGTGPRERRKQIRFEEGFRSEPVVQVGLSLYDIDSKANIRADIKAENITRKGFELVFRTWGDTRVARVRVGWTAIGELPFVDDWDLY